MSRHLTGFVPFGVMLASAACASNDHRANYAAWQQQHYLKMPFVKDAIQRWANKSHSSPDRQMINRRVEVMYFPTKACVQISFTGPSVGGVPIYCYAKKIGESVSEQLVEEYSNVE